MPAAAGRGQGSSTSKASRPSTCPEPEIEHTHPRYECEVGIVAIDDRPLQAGPDPGGHVILDVGEAAVDARVVLKRTPELVTMHDDPSVPKVFQASAVIHVQVRGNDDVDVVWTKPELLKPIGQEALLGRGQYLQRLERFGPALGRCGWDPVSNRIRCSSHSINTE